MSPDPEDLAEYFEERAAVLEFEQGFSREAAEREAARRTWERFGIGKAEHIPPSTEPRPEDCLQGCVNLSA